MAPWIDVPRQADGPLHKQPLVCLRIRAVAFNSTFTRLAELKEHKYVKIQVDPDLWRLGFRFHNEATDASSLSLGNDGGGRGGGGRPRRGKDNLAVQTNALMALHPWVAAIARQKDPDLRRFIPEYNNFEKLWIIALRPAFEKTAASPKEIPSDVTGIYRYVAGDEVIYIGKGAIRERAMDSSRENWHFDRIEYSRVLGEDQQYKWESNWLDWYQRKFGKLPLHNRVGGRRS